ncbi:MAG: phosphate acetyltransferase [Peptococcaceae bacterium]|nr:phosphate acetyltransferase [Peptococcaceae bacterium]
MSLLDTFKEKAKANKKKIVLPEGNELRTLKGAVIAAQEGLAEPILLGDKAEIIALAEKEGLLLDGVTVVDIAGSEHLDDFAEFFYELRKHKGMTPEKAAQTVCNPLYFGNLMLMKGMADGLLAGADNTTGDVLRAALHTVKTKKGINTVSGAFVMILPEDTYGDNGVFIFGDCAVNPDPTAEQLADITISCAETKQSLIGGDSTVAMLSFSTKGSAAHPNVDKVTQALAMVKERRPDLMVDGELQLDAAVVQSVADKKAPGSEVAGKANVLVFPDLQSGNIGYKLVQRFANASAIGPILQGMAKPVNDLSRGCSVQDVVDMIAITALQCE